jgi:hypothetical protein
MNALTARIAGASIISRPAGSRPAASTGRLRLRNDDVVERGEQLDAPGPASVAR